MRWLLLLGGAAAIGHRIARARYDRILHPVGRSFSGELEVWGAGPRRTGAALLDRPGRHPVTVRVSKGAGTPPGWPDVLGLAVRVHGPDDGQRHDLLLSTAGGGRLSRHLPAPRRRFDTCYGSILSYRAGGPQARKLYLAAVPDPAATPLGRTLDAVVDAAGRGNAHLLLTIADGPGVLPLGRIRLGAALPAEADAALTFDPIRNTTDDLHPTGLVHASRAWAYRLSQRWRGAPTAPDDPAALTRTAAHR